jgi:ubiquinone biosynthesis monooxygenase Coq7
MSIPGDLSKKEALERIIRVNHAGEYGAKRIYAGQMAVLKNHECYDEIVHMAEQEEEHLAYFSQELNKRDIRPTALMPLWHVAAYAMGAATALCGEKAAMACTVAVEEVIDQHYQQQLAKLDEDEQPLKDAIEKFRLEELEHRDIGIAHDAQSTPGYELLSAGVKTASKFAIWLSKRV